MSSHTRLSAAPRWHARSDTAMSLLLAVLLHAAMIVTVSAHQVSQKETGTPHLLQASLIIESPPRPEPPQPKPVEVQPEPPRPKPPKAVERPKPKRIVARASEQAPPAESIALPEPPPVAPPVKAAVQAATAPSVPQPAPPRFDADYLNNPAPAYPAVSRRLGEEGRVMLRVFVKPDGMPGQVSVHQPSGFPRLDAAARDAVRQWRFVPAQQGATKIGAWVLVPIAFSLRS